MRKGKTVIGQQVVSFADGRKVDTVKDLVIGGNSDTIVALLVDEGGLLSSSRVIPVAAIQNFGRDAVVINDGDAVVTASSDDEIKAILNRKEQLLGKRVLTDTGESLGTVSDMYFEEGTGRIVGFEVSGGLIGDITRGNSYLAVDDMERMGPDVIFVRPETGEELKNQVGGVMGALNDAGSKIGDAASEARDGFGARVSESHPERALVGRRSGADVADETGSIVVANGQRIRQEHIDWAQGSDNMDALSRAAAKGQAAETRDRMSASLEEAGDDLGAVWDRFTRRLAEMRDENGRQVDEQYTRTRLAQIADAIGRPVGKVILDRNDNVIIDFGDIITHQAMQQAHDHGQLDTLLSSVVRTEIVFPPAQMRANQQASATVERASGGASLVQELEQKVQETDRQREERQQRERQEAEATARQRNQEREQRARARQGAEVEREREIEDARVGEPSA
ncbi:hypothetical protein BH23CHL7_BH23CHL7_21720 [soil metagenome]